MAVEMKPLKGEKIDRLLSSSGNIPHARFGAGGCVLAARFANSVQEILDFEVRDDDVWVVTPPKCGTTWTQEMVWLLLNNLDYERAKSKPLYLRCPFLEFTGFAPEEVVEELNLDTVKEAANLPSPRCIKTHLHKDLLPTQIWAKKSKIIYVAREPKDVAVSFYHHYKLFNGYRDDKEFFFQCYYEDLVEHAPLWNHIVEFWKIKDEPHILFNTFEQMKQDLPAVIKNTARFLGKEISEEQISRLAEHLDIKQMKKNPSTNYEYLFLKAREEGRINDDQRFIRKGDVGEGHREMSPKMAMNFDERTRSVFSDAVGGCPWSI